MGLSFLIYFLTVFMCAMLNSLVIIGAFNAAHDVDGYGNHFILHPVHLFFERVLGKYWSKPFLGCYRCMASVWAGVPMFTYLLLFNPVGLNNEAFSSFLVFLLFTSTLSFLYTCVVSGLSTYIYESMWKNENKSKYYMLKHRISQDEEKQENRNFLNLPIYGNDEQQDISI